VYAGMVYGRRAYGREVGGLLGYVPLLHGGGRAIWASHGLIMSLESLSWA